MKKAEVQTDNTGNWYGNSLRFASHAEADAYASDLNWRWTSVRDFRAVESEDPVNYRWDDATGAQRLEDKEPS